MTFNPDFGGDAGDLYQEIVEKNAEIRSLGNRLVFSVLVNVGFGVWALLRLLGVL